MKIVILGGTGLIGRALQQTLAHDVESYGRTVFSSAQTLEKALRGCEVVINLAGANIGARWSERYKQEIWDSRIETTRLLADVLLTMPEPPKRLVNASAIGFYPQTQCTAPFDETQTQSGNDFLAQLSVAWEAQAQRVQDTIPTVITRFGVVLSPKGGALAKMLPAFKLGLGGPVAGGEQCFSWISLPDLCRAIDFILQRPEIDGALNLCAPTPLQQKQFAKVLASTLHRPCFVPLPMWQLKLMFGEGAQVLTHSSAVLPTRLQALGFEFEHPTAKSALNAIL